MFGRGGSSSSLLVKDLKADALRRCWFLCGFVVIHDEVGPVALGDSENHEKGGERMGRVRRQDSGKRHRARPGDLYLKQARMK